MSENSSHGGIVDSLGDVIRGDIPIARYIFNDPSKRRLISRLKAEEWPIFDLAGKTRLGALICPLRSRRGRARRAA